MEGTFQEAAALKDIDAKFMINILSKGKGIQSLGWNSGLSKV
jgi:hypothetical protein